MKRTLLFSIALLTCIVGSAQFVGVDFSKAVIPATDDDIEYEELNKLPAGYIIPFEMTPIGIKHCWERLAELMEDNNFELEQAVTKDITLASYVEDILDYEALCTSLRAGGSEIYITWERAGWFMGLVMTKNVVSIMFARNKSKI